MSQQNGKPKFWESIIYSSFLLTKACKSTSFRLVFSSQLLWIKLVNKMLDKVKKFWKNPFNSFSKVCHTWWNARLQLSLFQWYRINIWDVLLQVSQSRKIEKRYYEVESTLEYWNELLTTQHHDSFFGWKNKNTLLAEQYFTIEKFSTTLDSDLCFMFINFWALFQGLRLKLF